MDSMSDDNEADERSWQIACAGDHFDTWRDDASFRAVVTLARIVNALNFAGYVTYGVENADSPAATRQRMNAFLYVAATLFEAIDFVDRVRGDLVRYAAFTERLAPLVDEPTARALHKERLAKLRNRGVFHFDPTFVPRKPDAEADGYYVFVKGRSMKSGETYYDLPDRSLLNSVIGVTPSHTEFSQRARSLMHETTRLMTGFIGAANELINEALDHADWEPKFLPSASEDLDPAS